MYEWNFSKKEPSTPITLDFRRPITTQADTLKNHREADFENRIIRDVKNNKTRLFTYARFHVNSHELITSVIKEGEGTFTLLPPRSRKLLRRLLQLYHPDTLPNPRSNHNNIHKPRGLHPT